VLIPPGAVCAKLVHVPAALALTPASNHAAAQKTNSLRPSAFGHLNVKS
jgi:hypothetical protein